VVIPIDQLGPEGKKLYEFNTAEAKRPPRPATRTDSRPR
jgi:hypothetical protein